MNQFEQASFVRSTLSQIVLRARALKSGAYRMGTEQETLKQLRINEQLSSALIEASQSA